MRRAESGGNLLHHPENEAEARGIEAHLQSQGIDCQIVRFGDTAYPGIVDRGRPWGAVVVSEHQVAKARTALIAWNGAKRQDLDAAQRESGPYPLVESPPGQARRGLYALLSVALFVLLALALGRSVVVP